MSWTVKMGRKAAVQWDDDMTILTMNEKKQTLRASISSTSATVLGLDLDRRCILETALTDQEQEVVQVLVQGDALCPRIVSTRPCVSPPSSISPAVVRTLCEYAVSSIYTRLR